MNTKIKIIRTFAILISLAAYFFSIDILYRWLEVYFLDSDVLWNIQIIKFYILLSIALFAIINLTLKIESLIKHNSFQFLQRNLAGLYGYLLGTGIYIGINITTFEFILRVYGLFIPFITTLIGFLFYKGIDLPKKILRKKLLITINLIILFYWSVVLLEFHQILEARNKLFGDELTYFENAEKKFFNKSDSLSYALSEHLRIKKSSEEKHSSKFKIDSVAQEIIKTELRLHQEFRNYSQHYRFFQATNESFSLWSNKTLQILIAVGFILIVVLNGLYLIYFHRD